MAGTFIIGETKVRPGAYFRVTTTDVRDDAITGIVVALFKATFGPLEKVVEIDCETDDYTKTFGSEGTTDVLREAIGGGAKKIYAVRVGKGGTASTVTLEDNGDTPAAALTITSKTPGEKAFTVSIRTNVADDTLREATIYDGTKVIEKVLFAAGAGEAKACADAFADSKRFDVAVAEGKEDAILADVNQKAFTAGEAPTVTNEEYSQALTLVEPKQFNTICVDTEDTGVHALLAAFVNRIYEAGSFGVGVIAEKHSVTLDTRIEHGKAFNSEKMVYLLNAYTGRKNPYSADQPNLTLDGYQTAARIAGMVASTPSNQSLTHNALTDYVEIKEELTNAEIISAIRNGCLCLSYGPEPEKVVWIESAINTLVNPDADHDDGWKKIRRTMTRFEMMRRMNQLADKLVAKLDNDVNGRNTFIAREQAILDAMIEESKLTSGTITESKQYPADADYAYFDVSVVDKDSLEKIYMTYVTKFSTAV